MQFSQGDIRKKSRIRDSLLVFFLLWGSSGQALVEKDPLHWSGRETIWDRKKNTVLLKKGGTVRKYGETLTAEEIFLDLDSRTVVAKGNCVYQTDGTLVQSDEIHFSLDTSAGSIIGGTVTNGRFLLTGERINKLSAKRYQTHRAQYTTCLDCPGSWSFEGEDVDLEFGGYAHMSNVVAKVKDAPVVWFPYLILPLKTERETGLLFPVFGTSSSHGFMFVQPFFWNISRSVDMTFGLGGYTKRGWRGEWEGRYALSPLSGGQGNIFYQQDYSAEAPPKLSGGLLNHRYGVNFKQTQELPLEIMQKLKLSEISDNKYPTQLSDSGRGDVLGVSEPVLSSYFSLSNSSENISSILEFQRHRNLLNFSDLTEFDTRTVQVFPKASIGTNDRILLSPYLTGGVGLGVSHFTRSAAEFDKDPASSVSGFVPGVDPIRKATRFYLNPTVYLSTRPGGLLSVVPRAEYRGYYYQFPNDALLPLWRGYMLFQTDVSMELSRIYERDDPEYPRIKNRIRPQLRYSLIPFISDPSRGHDFLSQIQYRSGYLFDNYDVVPVSISPSLENYFVPLGHSITGSVSSQWIRKHVTKTGSSYENFAELRAAQTLDIRELQNVDNKPENQLVPLSRLELSGSLGFQKLSWGVQYYYYPFLERLLPSANPDLLSPHTVSTSMKYTLVSETRQQILAFERSFTASYSYSSLGSRTSSFSGGTVYSINDYLMPSLSANYDFQNHRLVSITGALAIQSPSRCWRFTTSMSDSVERGTVFQVEGTLNLTGDGFSGIESVASGVVKR